MGKPNNAPTNGLGYDDIEPDIVMQITNSIYNITQKATPQTGEQLEEFIFDSDHGFFIECAKRGVRPGIELLCLALGCNRSTFWRWCSGYGKSKNDKKWMETCVKARQTIVSYLEQLTYQGKLNPASSIFYLKNWANYRDQIDIGTGETDERRMVKTEELPDLTSFLTMNDTGKEKLPDLSKDIN